MLGTEVDLDPMLGRLVKVKDKKRQEETSVIKKSARDFGKKLNHLAEAVNYLFEQNRAQEKRLNNLETELPKDIAERNRALEKRLDEVRETLSVDITNLTERIEVKHH
jgi:predicted transcriptional regulator